MLSTQPSAIESMLSLGPFALHLLRGPLGCLVARTTSPDLRTNQEQRR